MLRGGPRAFASRLCKVVPSSTCPAREDIISTPLSERWKLWEGSNDVVPTHIDFCIDGCKLDPAGCESGRLAPCCVKRQQAIWPVPCRLLRGGCPHNPAAWSGTWSGTVRDLGALSIPSVESSRLCPSFADVANTRGAERQRIWDDGRPNATTGLCSSGCRLTTCGAGHHPIMQLMCCVKRLRVVQWPMPCHHLRHGCNASQAPSSPFRRSHEDGQPEVKDWHAIPRLESSDTCPAKAEILNTVGAERLRLWEDPTERDDCRFVTCSAAMRLPCSVRRVRAAAWSIPCAQLPLDMPSHACPSSRGERWPSDLVYAMPKLADVRMNARLGSGPWLRKRYGKDATPVNTIGLPLLAITLVISALVRCSCVICCGRAGVQRRSGTRVRMTRRSLVTVLMLGVAICTTYPFWGVWPPRRLVARYNRTTRLP